MSSRKQKLGNALRGGASKPKEVAPPQPQYREAVGEYVMAPMELIDPDPDQPREEFTPEDIESLAVSMEKNDQRQPINLRRLNDGRLMIREGERRWRAAQLNGWTHIKAVIEDQGSNIGQSEQADLLRAQRAENIDRQALTLWEDIKACERYIQLSGKSQTEAADDLNMSKVKLSKMRKVLKASPAIQDLVRLDLCTNLNTLGSLADLDAIAPEVVKEQLGKIRSSGVMPERAETLFAELTRQAKAKQSVKLESSDDVAGEDKGNVESSSGSARKTRAPKTRLQKKGDSEAPRVSGMKITPAGELQITDHAGEKRCYRVPSSFREQWAILGEALFKE